MNQTTQILLTDVNAALKQALARYCGSNKDETRLLENSLLFWLDLENLEGGTALIDDFLNGVLESTTHQDTRPIAALGLCLATLQKRGATIPPHAVESFAERLSWQTGCSPRIGGHLQPFCLDSLALFGLTVGALLDDNLKNKLAHWVEAFLVESYSRRNIPDWEKTLLASVGQLLSVEHNLVIPPSASCAAFRLILSRHPALTFVAHTGDERELLVILKESVIPPAFTPLAFNLAALRDVMREAPVSAPNAWHIEDVYKLLFRFPRGMERWTWEEKSSTGRQGAEARHWHIDNEYHVQNLLWSVLAPIFPDLESEFYTEPIAQKRPRADLGLPSLSLVIEAKFLRVSDKPQKIIDEIASDASLYRSQGSKWQYIIAFIWDDGRRTEIHDSIRQGLDKLEGIVGTVILSRPGKMEDAVKAPSNPALPSNNIV